MTFPAASNRPPVRPGVQPEVGGRLQCLECGQWFIRLGHHVVAKHRLSCEEYRLRHGLARSHALEASGLRQWRSQRGKELFAQDPDGLRAQLTPTRTTAAERVAMSAAARRESARRPGAKAQARANGMVVGAAQRAASDAELDRHAAAAGFTDVHAMLAATAVLPAAQVAAMLGVRTVRVWNLRRRHGYVSGGAGRPPALAAGETRQCRQCGGFFRGLGQHIRGKHAMTMAQYHAAHPVEPADLERSAGQPSDDPRRKPLALAELAALRRGAQPRDPSGRLLCRECGRWYLGLAQHLATAHGLSSTEYRGRHGLPAELPLLSEQTRRLRTEQAASRARPRPPRVTAAQARRERLDGHARDAGYADLVGLLQATVSQPAAAVGQMLQVSAKAVARLRQQHCPMWTPQQSTPPQPLTAPELVALPAGVQPERDGYLACRRCGQWQRGLGQHTRLVHSLSPAGYRAEFELPAGRSLMAPDLRQRRAELGRERFDRVGEAMRRALPSDPAARAARAAAAKAAGEASRTRAGSRLAAERNAEQLRHRRKAEAAQRHLAKARALGYDSLAELINATSDLPGWRLAQLLDVHPHTAYRLRRQIQDESRPPAVG